MKAHLAGILAVSFLISTATADAARQDSHSPRFAPAPSVVPMHAIEPKNVPDFADDASATQALNGTSSSKTALQSSLESTTLPVQTKLKLVVEQVIDARQSKPGDIFEGHCKEDLFVGRSLLLPRGSLVRGRVVEVSKPRLISRAGKIGLRLEQIVTPTGEVIPLDAALEFQKGITNTKGELDPGTNFGTRVGGGVKTVTGMNSQGAARGALVAANIATLGAPAVATLIGGSAIALFRSGDDISLMPGQEIEIMLTNELGVQLN